METKSEAGSSTFVLLCAHASKTPSALFGGDVAGPSAAGWDVLNGRLAAEHRYHFPARCIR